MAQDDWFTQGTVAPAERPRQQPRGPVAVGGRDPRLQSQVTRSEADAQAAAAQAPYAGPQAAADARRAEIEAQMLERESRLGVGGKKWADETMGYFAQRYGKLMDQADSAREMLAMYDIVEDAIASGTRTGFGAESELNLRRFGQLLGIDADDDKISGGELIRSIQNRMALIMRSPDSGAGMPGSVSDRDIRFLKDSQIGLDRSPEGNARMLRAFRALEQRKIDIANLADEYVLANGMLDTGFNSVVRDYASGNGIQAQIESEAPDERLPGATNPVTRDESMGIWGQELYGADGRPLGPEGGPSFDRDGNPMGFAASIGGDIEPEAEPIVPQNFQTSLLGQGLSGVNEGISSTLGLPVDLTTGALNLIPQGVNAIANTDIPTIENPVLGGQWWNDRLTDVGSIFPEAGGAGNQFARRAGQSIGAASVPGLGAARTGNQAIAALLSGAGGGLGAATAQQAFPDNPLAEIAGELVGGGLGGYGALRAGQRSAQREIESAIPTTQQLREEAGDLYRQAESRGVVAGPTETRAIADDIATILRDEGQIGPRGAISDADSSTSKAFNLINQYAGSDMTPTEMNTIRRVIADGRSSSDASDRRLASILLNRFDDWTEPFAPEFKQAREVSRRYLTAEDLERAREAAGASASQFTGSGFENALRTQYRGLDRANIRGNAPYPQPVVDAIRDVSRGTPASNAARAVGRFAPTGVVSFGLGSGAPAALGTLLGGPGVGLATGVGTATAGGIGRTLATNMGIRAADVAELTARQGGVIPQAPLAAPGLENMIAAILAGSAGQYLD